MTNDTKTQDGVTYALKTDNKGELYWCVTEYNGESQNLTAIIVDEIDGHPVKEICEYAFNCWGSLRVVEIKCGTVTLRPNAFYRCRDLHMLTFHKLDRIKAEPKAITNPDPHLVIVATTECKGKSVGSFKIDAFTTHTVNKIFRKNGTVVYDCNY